MDFDWKLIKNTRSITERTQLVRNTINACKPGENVFLSDCILRAAQEGVFALMELAAQEEKALRNRQTPMLWKILCLKDEWGNIPNPGDKIIKTETVNMKDAEGNFVTSSEVNVALNDGTYGKQFQETTEYIVDEKGCIECSKNDAVYFINRYGVHPRSGKPFSSRKEHSTEPVLREDGQKMHVWYRRFKEIEPTEYEKLPKRYSSDEPKRGTKNDR